MEAEPDEEAAHEIMLEEAEQGKAYAMHDMGKIYAQGIGCEADKEKAGVGCLLYTSCDRVDKHVLKLIEQLQPKYYFIENPRGGMRKMEWMKNLPRYTVTYCQYGDNRMKPTDIWTNHPNPEFLPMCHNGD